jgi:hypothetical protein
MVRRFVPMISVVISLLLTVRFGGVVSAARHHARPELPSRNPLAAQGARFISFEPTAGIIDALNLAVRGLY